MKIHTVPSLFLSLLMIVVMDGATPPPAWATQITVNTTTDELNADGDCSLREAVRAANLDTAVSGCPAGNGADEIVVPAGTYTLTIPGRSEFAAATGDLNLTGTLTMTGAGVATTIIDGNDLDRVFQADGDITVQRMTVRNGFLPNPPGAFGFGGGIVNADRLHLSDCTLVGNVAGFTGGGIFNDAELTVTNCTISGNTATEDGGGFSNGNGAVATLSDSTISNNTADLGGGIKDDFGELTLLNCTVSNNTTNLGGGLYLDGTVLTMTDTTVHDNIAHFYGGGIYSSGSLTTLTRSTVADNTAEDFGGGIFNAGSLVQLTQSTVSGNTTAGEGGGLNNNSGVAMLMQSTVSANTADECCGGIASFGGLTVTNSTISGNSTKGDGGGILENGKATLTQVTITDNMADSDSDGVGDGGGVFSGGRSLSVRNTLIAGNHDNSPGAKVPDCAGKLKSKRYNLVGNGVGCIIPTTPGNKNLVGTGASPIDPLLGPLQDNGGTTVTHALLSGSPALDRMKPSACKGTKKNPLNFDQRGVTRPQGTACDIGAYEAEP